MSSGCIFEDNYIYITFPELPVYLKRDSLLRKTEGRNSVGLSKYCHNNSSLYIVFPKGEEGHDFLDGYIKSATQSQVLFRKSADWNHYNFVHCLRFSEKILGRSTQSENNDPPCKRGVCIYLETHGDVKDSEESLLTFLKANDFYVGKIIRTGKQYICKNLSPSFEAVEVFPVICVDPKCISDEFNASHVSPIFTASEISPVFHSFQEARKVLKMCLDMPEVDELLEITDRHVCHQGDTPSPDRSLQYPFVVVEGMDATGKTTLTQILEEKLGAARYYTPPSEIQHLRPFFDKLPEIVRRAYYHIGNHIVAEDIIKECQKRPVIMDRFWYSTSAYGIANETSSGDLPRRGHPVYRWPTGLLKPTLVLFLTVSEDVRKQRHSGRGLVSTFEERSLDKDQLFRQRLCDSYRRMEEPACVEIDASGTVEEVSALAEKALEEHGILLNKTSA